MTEIAEIPHGTPNTNPFHTPDPNNEPIISPESRNISPKEVCKKCNQPINEGHAYELGEDRWHINCFNCSKCNISLGCNSNFLVLGNGNLICSNCSYNCKQCGRKIDDLAILTGDQAYCSNCFKCRSCKKKIEDLRYARTSKGLFCMECHEKLMAKKKKYDAKKKKMELAERNKLQKPGDDQQQKLLLNQLHHQNEIAGSVDSHRENLIQSYLQSDFNTTAELDPGMNQSSTSLLSKHKNLPLPPTIGGMPNTPPVEELLKDSTPSSSVITDIATTGAYNNGGGVRNVQQPEPVDDFSIEEVQNSDEEEEQLSRNGFTLRNRSHSPSKLQNHAFATPSTPSQDTESILEKAIHNDITTGTSPPKPRSTTTVASGSTSYHSPKQGAQLDPPISIDSSQDQLAPPHSKNVLILSPNQFNDNEFHSIDPLGSHSPQQNKSGTSTTPLINSNTTSSLAIPSQDSSRSIMSSPMAKANRQARVVETTSDDILSQEISDEDINNDPTATPKKPKSTFHLSSPPPKVPVPSTPPVPIPYYHERTPDVGDTNHKRQKSTQSELKGLGLISGEIEIESEEIHEAQSGSPKKSLSSPMTIHAERNESQGSNSISSQIGRKSSLLRSLKSHNRSSLGSISNSIVGFFGNKKDDKNNHRGPDGIVNAKISSPVFSPQIGSFQYGNNITNDGNKEIQKIDVLRNEIIGLEKKRTNLTEDIKELTGEKNDLLTELKTLQSKIAAERSRYDNLSMEIAQLSIQKQKFKDESKSLTRTMTEDDDALTPTNSGAYSSPLAKASSDNSDTTVSLTEVTTIEEQPDVHKSTRLMFWRRGKNEAAASNNGRAGPNLSMMANSTSQTTKTTQAKGKFSRSMSTNILDTLIGDSHNSNHGGVLVNSAPLFSSTIARRAEFEAVSVPLIIRKCLTEVEKRGLDFEGIYRISGGNSSITAIETTFANLGQRPDSKTLNKLNDVLSSADINSVTLALKRYLRKLPDPIISYSLYDEFIDLAKIEQGRDAKISKIKRDVVEKLPRANRETLALLCRHLRLVDGMKGVNKMNFKNLSVVFAPTLARDEVGDREMQDMAYRNESTEILLSESDKIFT